MVISLKLFTIKVTVPCDPTVAIATTQKVILTNYVRIYEKEDMYVRVFCEANLYNPIKIDDNLVVWYKSLINLWWILLVLNSIVLIVDINNRLEKRKWQLELA